MLSNNQYNQCFHGLAWALWSQNNKAVYWRLENLDERFISWFLYFSCPLGDMELFFHLSNSYRMELCKYSKIKLSDNSNSGVLAEG